MACQPRQLRETLDSSEGLIKALNENNLKLTLPIIKKYVM